MRRVGSKIFEIRGRDWQAFGTRRKANLVQSAFQYWRDQGFPHYDLSEQEVKREYLNLVSQPVCLMSRSGIAGSVTGLRLANFFQPQMWSVRVSRYLSPIDVFNSDQMLRAAIQRSWSIWPDRFGANPATLRRILKTFPGAASVSNFRPTVARSVVERFSSSTDTVVDFSAGYGGRLLGAVSRKRTYIGIEPCFAQVAGLTQMLDRLKGLHPTGHAEIVQGCAEDVMPLLARGCAGLVFSSPPYFDWEKYSTETSQSFIRHGTYEEWKNGFLQPVLWQSARVLRKGGYLVLNISTGRRKPDASDVRLMGHWAGLEYLKCIPLLISRVPYLHPRNDMPHKREALLVFGKQ